ncbi:CoA pyrophosphatase [Aquabacterium sp. CECT 9606]|uniref:CoA pyrophosphatase n=1 Tax=Aquabacterium sp. CECT 9606 TaxID=2845822 RepID=UPI001E5A27CE|nr:CoA pyrophosphatase [Aquabacterium sp. CECT 9606]CAH0354377.1 putative Nudix hydrolase NudL [Aquabacterium sp. CECT 9606]
MALPFDPQATEVLGYDQHLPAVGAASLTAHALRQRFKHPPEWTPDVEIERWFNATSPRPAAVLIPLVMRPEPTVLLTQRSLHLKAHGGQISFPGGRHEPADITPVNTALREAHEEVGLHPERVEVLGSLPTYTTNSGFVVTPVVGLLQPWDLDDELLKLERQPGEVDDIFEVPLAFLMNPAHHQRRMLIVAGAPVEFLAMPWSSTLAEEPYFIWGATAAMLRNLYRFLAA